MAYVMFVFRIWRKKISRKSNFVSHNCYVCLEINFGGLIILINNLRDNGFDEYFLPFYIQSQHCEAFFRTMRSWAGSQSTKNDGTVLECLSTIRQIHSTQSQALYLTENGYNMPKQGKYDKIKSISVPKLPSNEQMSEVLISFKSASSNFNLNQLNQLLRTFARKWIRYLGKYLLKI